MYGLNTLHLSHMRYIINDHKMFEFFFSSSVWDHIEIRQSKITIFFELVFHGYPFAMESDPPHSKV